MGHLMRSDAVAQTWASGGGHLRHRHACDKQRCTPATLNVTIFVDTRERLPGIIMGRMARTYSPQRACSCTVTNGLALHQQEPYTIRTRVKRLQQTQVEAWYMVLAACAGFPSGACRSRDLHSKNVTVDVAFNRRTSHLEGYDPDPLAKTWRLRWSAEHCVV